jgi:WbqC-like protein family
MMQPYFVPYLGYYALIANADEWVVFDDSSYSRHGWIERNRTLHPSAGWQYIRIHLAKAPLGTKIKDIQTLEGWSDRVLRQLDHYRARAPYFRVVREFLGDTFASAPSSLGGALVHTLRATCAYLSLEFRPKLNSDLEYDRALITGRGDWARIVASEFGATRYINPPGGRAIFNRNDWNACGIELLFLDMPVIKYHQLRPGFEPHLSIVDVMMFNRPAVIKEMLNAARFVP